MFAPATSFEGHAPSWYAARVAAPPVRPPALGALSADVAVVGAGFTGLSAALHLAGRGFDVVVLEAARVGAGASGRNGGQIHSGQRRDQHWIEEQVGRDRAKRLYAFGEEAKALLRSLITRHGIDCDLSTGLVYADHKPGFVPKSHAYVDLLTDVYGYPHAEKLSREQLRDHVVTDDYHGGFIDRDGGHLNPLALTLGLAAAAETAGARIHEGSRVTRVTPGAAGRKPRLELANGASVTATHVILAGDGLMDGLDPAVDSRVMAIANYILTTEPLGERLNGVLRHGVAVADSRFVINYFRPTPDGRLLFGGGETWTRRLASDPGAIARRPMERLFPQLKGVKVEYAWGGLLGISANRMPYVRRHGSGVTVAAGFSGQGVALCPLYGAILAEAVAGTLSRFDVLAGLPSPIFPGGKWLRAPALIAAMAFFALRDRL